MALRLNPCELAIDLFCRGLEVDPSCDLARDARGIARTRAGLGSGLDMRIEGAPPYRRPVWLNAPLTEPFVARTPWLLRRTQGYEVVDRRDAASYRIHLPDEPVWYQHKTSRGKPMSEVGILQGTYLGVYVGPICRFWRGDQSLHCRFCTTGLNVDGSSRKTVEDVVETARVAKEESGVTFVHLNTGYQQGAAARLMMPFVEALKRDVGVLVGVQIAPEAPLEEFDALMDQGVDHLSFCFEYYDEKAFGRFCPGKQEALGQDAFFKTLEHCQSRLPKGACSGEIIAGNEPIEASLEAIDFITGLGAFPTVCIFRPLSGSDMESWPSPEPSDMRRVLRHVWNRCRDHAIPIGMAPNIDVSLVVQPTDAVYLSDGNWRDRWYRTRNALMRRLAAPMFRKRMRARNRSG